MAVERYMLKVDGDDSTMIPKADGCWVKAADYLRLESERSWQPIAAAPKDGTEFIAWDKGGGRCLYTAHWDGDQFITVDEAWRGPMTHWHKPLPPPPQEQPKGQD